MTSEAATNGTPTLVRRQLGQRLRELRERAGKTTADVSSVASRSKLWRIEEGRTRVAVGDATELARMYGADEATIEAIRVLAKGTSGRGWWEEYRGVVPNWLGLYLGLESSCKVFQHYAPELIPGLLQTADYARAVIGIGEHDPKSTEDLVRMRTARQATVLGRGDLNVRVILGQACLCLEVGSASTMEAQIEHLRELNTRERIQVRVIPWSAGAHVGLLGSFTLMDFADPADPSVAYEETAAGGHYMDTPTEVRKYRASFGRLAEVSIPMEEHAP